mmetsp:Transcript_68351/g.165325  ORF Transcript_68351/g.165325 Transcript_68351/m.165325 type:complete len:211 (-) Transcript_68351:749-1381(-)
MSLAVGASLGFAERPRRVDAEAPARRRAVEPISKRRFGLAAAAKLRQQHAERARLGLLLCPAQRREELTRRLGAIGGGREVAVRQGARRQVCGAGAKVYHHRRGERGVCGRGVGRRGGGCGGGEKEGGQVGRVVCEQHAWSLLRHRRVCHAVLRQGRRGGRSRRGGGGGSGGSGGLQRGGVVRRGAGGLVQHETEAAVAARGEPARELSL